MDGKPVRAKRAVRLRRRLILISLAAIVLLAAAGAGLFFLSQNESLTRTTRDVFIILLALEFLVVGAAMVALLIQLARLTLLLEMEIRPMLDNANEALETLRGTALFLNETLVEPVVRLQSSLAGLQRILEAFGVFRKPS
jgi:hypothetical protein